MNKKIAVGLIVKLAITAALVWYLSGRHELSPANLTKALSAANPFWLALSFLLSLVVSAMQIIRWHEHLKAVGFNFDRFAVVKSWLAGNVLGLVSPGRVAELGRGYFLDKSLLRECAKVTFAERAYFVAATLVMALLSILITINQLFETFSAQTTILATVFLIVIILTGTYITLKNSRPSLLCKTGFFTHFPASSEQKFYLGNLSLILAIITALQGYAIFNAFSPVSLTLSFAAIQITMAALIIVPITIGNIGIRETMLVILLHKTGSFEPRYAVMSGLIIFMQNILIPSIAGFVVIVFHKQTKTGGQEINNCQENWQ